MANWKSVKSNIIKAKDSVVDTADKLSDIASLYLKIRTTRSKIHRQYAEVGEYICANYEIAESDDEKALLDREIHASVDSIKALETKLAEYHAQLEAAKAKEQK